MRGRPRQQDDEVVLITGASVVLGEVRDTTAAEFARVTAFTYLGSMHGTQAALTVSCGALARAGGAAARRRS